MRGLSLLLFFVALGGAFSEDQAFAFGRRASKPAPPAPAPAPAPPPVPVAGPAPAPPPLPDFTTVCHSRIGGKWNFGQSPDACDVSDQQSPAFVAGQYAPVIFNDGNAAAGRPLYMSEMYPVIREMGSYYIRRRNPRVSDAELNGFVRGLFTLAHQESFWTHYRKGADRLLRFMRGDSLHGYGLMQIDDRSHSVAIGKGQGVDLALNMVYGLDIFYANWVRAASASCVSAPTDYRSRARAAWAAYNGGQGSICRWTNPNSQWSANDKGFNSKYGGQAWLPFVRDVSSPSALDVRCLAEGVRPCAAPKGGNGR